MIEIIKKVKDLTKDDLKSIFTNILVIPDFAHNELKYFFNDNDVCSWQVFCDSTGYSLIIFDDYTIKLSSCVYTINTIPTIKIINALLMINAIKLN